MLEFCLGVAQPPPIPTQKPSRHVTFLDEGSLLGAIRVDVQEEFGGRGRAPPTNVQTMVSPSVQEA